MKKYILFALIAISCLSSHSAWAQRTVPMNSSIRTDGLVAYYPFNGNANDESGNGNHGILEGNKNVPELTTDRHGKANSAYDFGGYYNYNWIKVPNSETLIFDKEMTISFWIQQSEFAGMDGWMEYSTTGPGFAAVCKAGDGNATLPGLYIMTGKGSNGNGISVSTNNSNGNAYYQSNWNHNFGANKDDYQLGDWLFISLVVNNTDKILYLNGVEVARDGLNREANFSSMNEQNLYIGIMAGGNMTYSWSFGAWFPFYGKIDDVRIYKRALTESEIKALYQFDDSSVSNIIYTVSPSNWTDVPSTNVTQGSRTIHGGLLQAMATVSGRTATFTLKKKDGSEFNNRGHIVVHYDSYDGTIVKSNVSYEAGITNPTVDVDLGITSGRRKYVIVIKSGDIFYYTKPITISADDSFSDVDLAIAGGSYFNTPILTTGKPFPFNIEIKNNSYEDWNGSFYLKCGKEDWLQWYEVSIEAGETKALLTKTYTPQTSGRKTLTLYYQTGGSGGGVEVDAGNFDNPFTISVADLPSSDKLATPDKNTFSATNVTETSFVANWGAVEGALYYDINVKKNGGDYANPVFCGGSSTTHVKVTGLNPGTSYQFQIRARNGSASQNSDWSASLPAAVTTMKSGTQPANISIYAVRGFDGKTPLTVGIANTYKVYVVNNGASDWSGSFYLKDGDANLKPWHNISLVGNGKAVQPLEFDYIPESIGKKTLTLYYQTNTSGSGIPVSAAVNNMNPMTIQVIADPTVNDELKLKSAIVCPETLELGQKATISAEVQNSGDTECAVFLTDDNTVISSRERVAPGQSKTINTTWEPTTSGTHSIAIYYKEKGVSGQKLVTTNGFSNPLSVNVTGIDNPTVTEAKMKLITKGCAPKEVIAGDVVYYHFRITDKNGKPLKGMKAQFDCTGSDKATHVETSPSDEEGCAVLSISTSGNDAIASRGKEVGFFCTDFIDEQGNQVNLLNGNSSDGEFSLKIHKGNNFTEATGFDDVESLSVTLDLGASAKANLKLIDGSASLSFPLTTNFIWKDDELLTKIEEEARFDGGIDAKFANCFELSAGYYNGSKSSRTYNWNDPAKTGWAILMSWIGVDHLYTSSQLIRTLDAVERWFGIKTDGKSKEEFFESIQEAREEQADSKYFGVNGGATLKRFKSWPNYMPVGKGTLFPDLKIPSNYSGNYNFTESKMKFELEASAMIEPEKHQIDLQTGNWLFGVGKNLKIKMSGDGNKIFSGLSPAKPTLLNPIPKNSVKLPEGLYQKEYSTKFGATMNFSMAAKEEEMYTSESRTTLEKISNSLNMESGIKLSVESMSDYICPEWMSKNNTDKGMTSASLAIGMGYNWKMSSKGAWANYLLSLANNPDTKNLASDIYPVFSDRYAINAPITYFLRCVDEEKERSLLSSLQEASKTLDNSRLLSDEFKVKDVLKIEQQESEKAEMNLSLPILEWGPVDLTFDCGLSLGFNYYPSESYYSLSDKKFFPVVVRSTSSLSSMCKKATTFIKNKFNEALGIEDKNGIVEEYEKIGKKFEDWVAPDISTVLTNKNSQHDINANSVRLQKRHPNLVSHDQKDICTFTYTLNDEKPNFNDETRVAFSHFYPAGLLLGITDQGDTLFVVSEVCDLVAIQGTDTLKATQLGAMKLETTIGADDLTPFGFTEDTPLDVYYSEEGREDIWHYLGPAGMTIMTDRMGKYMMATSIKNDVIAPEIMADLDEETGLLHIKVNENIGLRVNTLSVLVNGMKRDVTAINDSNFEVYLSEEDMQYMLTLYITINDLAGNQGSLFQIFNIDKDDPDGIRSVESEKDKIKIVIVKNTLKVEGAEPNTTIMLFSLKGDVIAKNKTDNSGKAQVRLNNLSSGVYIVTLSNGIAKKFLIK